jgi:hypothetical protein
MVAHDLRVRGASWNNASQKAPLILQMKDEDFPARFLQDVLTQSIATTPQLSAISTATVVAASQQLYQPVQRIVNVAMVQVSCNSVMFPRVDPTRIVSAGMVVRRVVRKRGLQKVYEDHDRLAAWMKNAQGQWSWQKLAANTEDLDPDPTLRPQLQSGDPVTDLALAAQALGVANTESTTPAFAAPPATCAAIGSTVLYGMVPTASSEVSDAPPRSPSITSSQLLSSLPGMLRSAQAPITPPNVPISKETIDYRWLNDDFLNVAYPPTMSGTPPLPVPSTTVADVQEFTLALKMLRTVFNAFDDSKEGEAVLKILNRRLVRFDPSQSPRTMHMGEFYRKANTALLDYSGYAATGTNVPQLVMPESWEWLDNKDESDLAAALLTKNTANATTAIAPQGRYQDNTRVYRLRMFARVKGETPNCPNELVWSQYSQPFRIAGWFETGDPTYPHPPVPLPDPTAEYMKNAKPNCSFQVPGNLMKAMQGTTLSGLMNGSAGGGGLSLGWICGFNIPLITICAFFVLTIFLVLLNIVFFWLPFIKICIPFPDSTDSD